MKMEVDYIKKELNAKSIKKIGEKNVESNMVKDSPEVAMAFIDELFRTMLPQLKKIDSCNMGLYFYAQTYKYDEIKISLGCERVFFYCELIIQNKNVILDLPEEKNTPTQ